MCLSRLVPFFALIWAAACATPEPRPHSLTRANVSIDEVPPWPVRRDMSARTHFESASGAVIVDTSASMQMQVHGGTTRVWLSIFSAPRTQVEYRFAGLKPSATYYLYEGSYLDHEALQSNASGRLSFSRAFAPGKALWLTQQSSPTPVHLLGSAETEDSSTSRSQGKKARQCAALGGLWTDPNTCTLTGPFTGTVEFTSGHLVLDCAGHTLSSAPGADTIVLGDGSGNVTIKNCDIDVNGGAGIFSLSNDNRFLNNTISGGWAGVYMDFTIGNQISGNVISDSLYCLLAVNGTSNTFVGNSLACTRGSQSIFEVNETFAGNHFSQSLSSALFVWCSGHNVLVDSNTFVGQGLLIQGGCNVPYSSGGTRGARNATVSNNHFDGLGVGWSAISFNSGLVNPKIDGNTISGYGSGVYFDVENKHIEITNNDISHVGSGISNASGSRFPGSDHRFAGNTIDDASGSAITLMGESNVDIVDNVITNSAGVMIAKTKQTRFIHNRISGGVASTRTRLATGDACTYQMVVDADFDSGVTVLGGRDAVIANNHIEGSAGDGVRVLPLKRARITVPPQWMNANPPPPGSPSPPLPETAGCLWSPAPYQFPPYLDPLDIFVLRSDEVTVRDNHIGSSGRDGIRLVETDDGTISDNLVSNSAANGTTLETSNDNRVTGNTYEGCGGVAILESGTSTGNQLSDNIDGC